MFLLLVFNLVVNYILEFRFSIIFICVTCVHIDQDPSEINIASYVNMHGGL